MKKIRYNTFETNSSSTHSLTMCTKEEFIKFKNDKLRYCDGEFISKNDKNFKTSYTYNDFSFNSDSGLEYFEQEYITPNGETIVAFGEYGYN